MSGPHWCSLLRGRFAKEGPGLWAQAGTCRPQELACYFCLRGTSRRCRWCWASCRSSHLRPFSKAGESGRGSWGLFLCAPGQVICPLIHGLNLAASPTPTWAGAAASLSPAINQLMGVPCAASKRAWILCLSSAVTPQLVIWMPTPASWDLWEKPGKAESAALVQRGRAGWREGGLERGQRWRSRQEDRGLALQARPSMYLLLPSKSL